MKQDRKPGNWAVIPAKVRYDNDLRPNAKLLYAEITALQDSYGYCWAHNAYFSKVFGLAARTISDLIGTLAEKGYIVVDIFRDPETNEVIERRIWTEKPRHLDLPPPAKNGYTPPAKNCVTPPAKNGAENNINSFSNNTPHTPQGGRRGKRRNEPREAPDWKPERFAGFWAFYPSKGKKDKQAAMDMWDKLHPDDELIDTIARALVKLKATEEWQRGVGIPYASTFLNPKNARWQDADAVVPEPGPESADDSTQLEQNWGWD